jgi:hypothetical protein
MLFFMGAIKGIVRKKYEEQILLQYSHNNRFTILISAIGLNITKPTNL